MNGLSVPDDYYLKSFRPFRDVFLWTAYARDFMTQYIPFWEMEPANELLPENSGYCFALKNAYYALYLEEARQVYLTCRRQRKL